jgi:hypothetical protein
MEHAPTPSAWPATLALGVTLVAAGVVMSPLLIAAGALVAATALAGWVSEALAEAEEHS